MKPYRFRLAAVQHVRESRRDDARLRLADANHAAEKLLEEEHRIHAELAEVRRKRAVEAAAAQPDANRLVEAQRYEMLLKAQLQDLAGKQRMVDEEIDRRRNALAMADREVRVLELLDEKGQERHRREELAAEQRELDEAAAVAWRRQNQSPTVR